ncbi:hypothetical protein KC909_02825, partial [Candidatus Dojkabacteria bacterium]|nr:hypothetical protein [Candidatus Dojkabacteria bacterium]
AINRAPMGHIGFLNALSVTMNIKGEIVIVSEDNQLPDKIRDLLLDLEGYVVIINDRTSKVPQLVKEKEVIDSKLTLYVCENFSCKTPIAGESEVIERLIQLASTSALQDQQ